VPVILKAYDLLEWKGEDIREMAFIERRKLLEKLFYSVTEPSSSASRRSSNNVDSGTTITSEPSPRQSAGRSAGDLVSSRQTRKADTVENPSPSAAEIPLHLSETIHFNSWGEAAKERERSREVHSEGLMLKRKDSPYLVGRKKGDWWKWKVAPLTIDAVLTYAMRGHGRRSNLFTDYTFALWHEKEDGEKELVTFAKAYSGLTDAEFRKVDNWIKRNTLERFGPVRSVTPHHVFEIAFEGIALSKRHKSGVATRFPRIQRWRQDKKIEEANTLSDLKDMIV